MRLTLTCLLCLALSDATYATSVGNSSLDFDGRSNIKLSPNLLQIEIEAIRNSSSARSDSLRIEYWATSDPYTGGNLAGIQLASWRTSNLGNGFDTLAANAQLSDLVLNFANIGSHEDFQFRSLVLTEFSESCTKSDGFCVVAYHSFDQLVELDDSTIRLQGQVTLEVEEGNALVEVDTILNSSNLNPTDLLRIEIWATTERYSEGELSGFRAAAIQLDAIEGISQTLDRNERLSDLEFSMPFSVPPEDYIDFVLVVTEFDDDCTTPDGFCLADHRTLGSNIPDPPEGISASQGEFTDKVLVEWNHVERVSGYEVYRCDSNSDDSCSFLQSVEVTSNQFGDSTVSSFDSFFYNVKACNYFGCSDFGTSSLGFTKSDDLSGDFRPLYDGQLIRVPAVYVDDGTNKLFYAVELLQEATDESTRFRLVSASEVEDPRLNGIPTFSISDAILRIPQLDAGGELYSLRLKLNSSADAVLFDLIDYSQL